MPHAASHLMKISICDFYTNTNVSWSWWSYTDTTYSLQQPTAIGNCRYIHTHTPSRFLQTRDTQQPPHATVTQSGHTRDRDTGWTARLAHDTRSRSEPGTREPWCARAGTREFLLRRVHDQVRKSKNNTNLCISRASKL